VSRELFAVRDALAPIPNPNLEFLLGVCLWVLAFSFHSSHNGCRFWAWANDHVIETVDAITCEGKNIVAWISAKRLNLKEGKKVRVIGKPGKPAAGDLMLGSIPSSSQCRACDPSDG
jgi:hypothetical protein